MPTSPSEGEASSLRSKWLRALERSPHEPYTGADERRPSAAPPDDRPGFSGRRAAEIVGISYRQLDYFARTDLIRPSVADAHSSTRRRYSYRDLIELKLVKTLLDNGIRLEQIREAFQYIRDELGEDVARAKLVIAGNSAVLVRGNDELIDVVSQHKGQGVLNFLDLEDVVHEVDAAIVDMVPGSDASQTQRASEEPA